MTNATSSIASIIASGKFASCGTVPFNDEANNIQNECDWGLSLRDGTKYLVAFIPEGIAQDVIRTEAIYSINEHMRMEYDIYMKKTDRVIVVPHRLADCAAGIVNNPTLNTPAAFDFEYDNIHDSKAGVPMPVPELLRHFVAAGITAPMMFTPEIQAKLEAGLQPAQVASTSATASTGKRR